MLHVQPASASMNGSVPFDAGHYSFFDDIGDDGGGLEGGLDDALEGGLEVKPSCVTSGCLDALRKPLCPASRSCSTLTAKVCVSAMAERATGCLSLRVLYRSIVRQVAVKL